MNDIITVLQTALTPAFLLVALGGMIGLFTERLSRIVDRARILQQHFADTTGRDHDLVVEELHDMRRRINVVSWAIILGVMSAITACVLIGLLFVMRFVNIDLSTAIAAAFVVAVSLMAAGLVMFLIEVRIAIRDVQIRDEYLMDETDR